MKGLKIFGWICFGLALVCLILPDVRDYIEFSWTGHYYNEDALHWLVVSLIFFGAAILSWLVRRALKEIKDDLELKILMET